MQMGINSGHVTCPKCKAFLHVEILEGDEASTELFDQWLARDAEIGSVVGTTIKGEPVE